MCINYKKTDIMDIEHERWRVIDDFDDYEVSNLGAVRARKTSRCRTFQTSKEGICWLAVRKDGRQYSRTLSRLVANAFVENNFNPIIFDTPTHIDGDKTNCRAENLMWRPRWFSVAYHRQFSTSEYLNSKASFRCIETGSVYESVRDVVHEHGVLAVGVIISASNQNSFVFPHKLSFDFL